MLPRFLQGVAPALLSLTMIGALGAQPLVVGHRGTGSDAGHNPWPENSLPSLERAFAEGTDLVEVDVQLDRDGVPILWHDATVEVDGDRRDVQEVARAEFPLLEGPTGITAEVPTFREALRSALALGPAGKVLDIELKIEDPEERAPLVQAVAQVLREERAARRVLFSSFDVEALALVEQELPGVESGLLGLFSWTTLRAARKALERGIAIEWVIRGDWVLSAHGAPPPPPPGEAEVEWFGSGFVSKAHALGLRAGRWTVNDAEDIADLAEDGYDMIITDEPDVARSVLDGYQLFAQAD